MKHRLTLEKIDIATATAMQLRVWIADALGWTWYRLGTEGQYHPVAPDTYLGIPDWWEQEHPLDDLTRVCSQAIPDWTGDLSLAWSLAEQLCTEYGAVVTVSGYDTLNGRHYTASITPYHELLVGEAFTDNAPEIALCRCWVALVTDERTMELLSQEAFDDD